MRSDFSAGSIRDCKLDSNRTFLSVYSFKTAASLRKIKEKKGSSTRKLIGHSGPVYSVDFDPLSGSAAPPKYLLSASADGTSRLWSMDTMTDIVAFRGHENPVWDVKWSPLGMYFATASRDRTARLWSTDRTACLRIYAGHLADVDVSVSYNYRVCDSEANGFNSVSGFIPTPFIWLRVQAIGQLDYGTFSEGPVFEYSLAIKGPSLLWLSAQMVDTLPVQVCGCFLRSTLPDHRILGEDLAINLWDIGSGKRIKKMTGHTASIYSLAFSAESSLLVSGGADWTVRCWDVKGAGGVPSKRDTTTLGNGSSTPPIQRFGEEGSIEP